MIYDKPTILRRAAFVVAGARHADYEREDTGTVDYAEKCTAYTTGGEGMDKYLERFAPRETADEFTQRLRLTKHVSKSSIARGTAPYEKTFRAKPRITLEYEDKNQARLEELTDITDNFAGRGVNVDQYLRRRLISLNKCDPGTFIVIEFGEYKKTERAQPYPFEVDSRMAVDYVFQKGVLQYLIAHTKERADEIDPNSPEVNRYTVYLPNQTVVIQETTKEERQAMTGTATLLPADDKKYSIEPSEDYTAEPYWLRIGSDYYRVTEALPHKLGYVPAVQAGYEYGEGDMSNMLVSLFDAAMPHLDELTGINSQLHLTMALSAFPMEISFEEDCAYRTATDSCHRGYLSNGSVCPSCGGTGQRQRPTSSQQALRLTAPNDWKEAPDLRNVLVFVSPEVALLQFQNLYRRELLADITTTIFNSENVARQGLRLDDTATGRILDLDEANHKVHRFAMHEARVWKFIIDTVARFTDLYKGLVSGKRYDQDMRMKTEADLLADLESATRAEAGAPFRSRRQMQLMERVTADDPDEFARYQAQERFNPFSGKTEAEIMTILNLGLVTKEAQILYANLGNIFDTLSRQYGQSGQNFYKLTVPEQDKAVEAEVQRIMDQIKNTQPPVVPLETFSRNGKGVEKEEAA